VSGTRRGPLCALPKLLPLDGHGLVSASKEVKECTGLLRLARDHNMITGLTVCALQSVLFGAQTRPKAVAIVLSWTACRKTHGIIKAQRFSDRPPSSLVVEHGTV